MRRCKLLQADLCRQRSADHEYFCSNYGPFLIVAWNYYYSIDLVSSMLNRFKSDNSKIKQIYLV